MYSEEYSDDEVEQESGNFIVNFYNNNKVLVWIMIGVIAFILIMTLLTGGGSSKSKDYEIRVLHDGDVIVSVGHSENILTEFKADLSAVPKWSSKNENIVKVDNGNIVGVNYGTAKVTVTYETNNKAYSKDIDVIVADGDPNLTLTNVEFKKGDLFMPLNSTYTIAPVLTPPRAYVLNKVYTSSNERVVRVDNTGLVSSVGEGEATIILNVNDGAFKRDLNVYVSSEYTNSEIIVTPTQIIFDGELRKIKVGSTENLTYTTVPADASRDKLIWKSSDESIVAVDETGKVTAIKGGTATVTVSSVNGVNDKIDIEVENDLVPVTDINLSVTSLSLNVGQTETISPVVVPDNASNKALSFLPGDSTIISVIPSNTGTFANVTALNSGSTTLTIKSFDGVEKTIAVNVTGGGSSGGGGSSSGGGTTIKVRVNGDEPTKQCNNQELTYYNNPTVTVDLSGGVSKIKYCYGTSVCSPNTEATSSTSFTINQSGLIILRIKKYDTNGNEIASSNNNNYVDDALEYYINTKSSGTKCTRTSDSGSSTTKGYTIVSGKLYITETAAKNNPLTTNSINIKSTNSTKIKICHYTDKSLNKDCVNETNYSKSFNSEGTHVLEINGDVRYFVISKSAGNYSPICSTTPCCISGNTSYDYSACTSQTMAVGVRTCGACTSSSTPKPTATVKPSSSKGCCVLTNAGWVHQSEPNYCNDNENKSGVLQCLRDVSEADCKKKNGTGKTNATCPSISGYTGTYDGKNHTITVTGKASGGSLQYSTDGSNWVYSSPQRSAVGTTRVYVRVLGDSTHNTVNCGNVNITINSAATAAPPRETVSIEITDKSGSPLISGGLTEYAYNEKSNVDGKFSNEIRKGSESCIKFTQAGFATVSAKANQKYGIVVTRVSNNECVGYIDVKFTSANGNIASRTVRVDVKAKAVYTCSIDNNKTNQKTCPYDEYDSYNELINETNFFTDKVVYGCVKKSTGYDYYRCER